MPKSLSWHRFQPFSGNACCCRLQTPAAGVRARPLVLRSKCFDAALLLPMLLLPCAGEGFCACLLCREPAYARACGHALLCLRQAVTAQVRGVIVQPYLLVCSLCICGGRALRCWQHRACAKREGGAGPTPAVKRQRWLSALANPSSDARSNARRVLQSSSLYGFEKLTGPPPTRSVVPCVLTAAHLFCMRSTCARRASRDDGHTAGQGGAARAHRAQA